MNIYIGNFSSDVMEEDLKQAFEAFGEVQSVKVIKDKFSGESRGFGFVEMASKAEGEAAINGIKELKGRKVTINEARPRESSGSGYRSAGGGRGGPGRGHSNQRRGGGGGWR